MDVMATSPFGNNMDPLASHRKTMEQARKIMDPAAGYRGYLEVNPLAEYRRIMEQAKAVDPLASHRKTMEQARKIMDPAAGYRGYLKQSKLVDPLGTRRIMDQARRAMDPLAEYRRIVRDFSALVGMDPSSIASEALGDADEQATPEIASDRLAQDPALIVTLLSIAWCCGWLLAQGADVERVGGLLQAALGLAAHFAGKSRGDQD